MIHDASGCGDLRPIADRHSAQRSGLRMSSVDLAAAEESCIMQDPSTATRSIILYRSSNYGAPLGPVDVRHALLGKLLH